MVTENNQLRVKYSIFGIFKAETGMIKVRDFLVTYNSPKVNLSTKGHDHNALILQIIGLKHIFFSNNFLEKGCEYEIMANNSFPVSL